MVADPKGSPLDVAGVPLPELVPAGVPALGVPLNGFTGACVPAQCLLSRKLKMSCNI